jgi:PKD repeat protein/lysophospholipase L1-like esterase
MTFINYLRISVLITLSCMAWLVQATIIEPSNPNIQYSGRWNFDNPAEPTVAWQGSTILVKFNGTSISADINPGTGTEYFRVIVDGVANPDVLQMRRNRKIYVLADNLPAGEHTVVLMKETFYTTKTTFYGFDIAGTLLAPPAKPSLRIEFFGDSNMDGTSNYSEKNTGESGTYYAYPAMVSRMLEAEMNLEAVGGATLDNGGDGGDNDVQSFIYSEDYYNQDPNYRSGFDPQVIVVNAGANDVGAGESEIKSRYRTVINDLRTVYGNTPHIVLMNAYGWDLNEPANYSQDIVNEIGGNLSVLHFPWLWEQWHGSQWDHSGQAHMLAQHIASLNPAWSIKHANDIVDGFGRNGDFANGSFEYAAPFGGFGWRYVEDGVERLYDPVNAADGDYFIRLDAGERVHQPTDATGDLLPGASNGGETYTIRAKMRGVAAGAKAQISTHFEGQELYTHDDDPGTYQTTTFDLSTQWQEYTHTATSSAGVWTIFNYLIADSGSIEIDDVRMTMDNLPPSNHSPVADFTPSSTGLVVSFTDTSSDSDGVITQWAWDFADGTTSSNQHPDHAYAAAGSYLVDLTVTDDDGATNTVTKNVTVSEGSSDVILSITSASLTRGRLRVTLNWSGASTSNVEIFRNGNSVWVTANDGSYQDSANKQANGAYTYQVCETDGGACSNLETVVF